MPCRGNFLASCIPKGASDGKSAPSWQDIAAVYPKRAGIGKICAPCIRKALQTAFRECIARRSCQGGALFAALVPRIMHGALILPFLGVSFGCCGRGEGRGGARGEGGVPAQRMRLVCCPALCGAARCFHGFASCGFELSPPTRTMFLLPRLPSRETCPLPPCDGVFILRRPLRVVPRAG